MLNTPNASFWVDSTTKAVHLYGSRLPLGTFVTAVTTSGARRSMDGNAAWTDHILTKRFWHSLKVEEVYLRDSDTGANPKR